MASWRSAPPSVAAPTRPRRCAPWVPAPCRRASRPARAPRPDPPNVTGAAPGASGCTPPAGAKRKGTRLDGRPPAVANHVRIAVVTGDAEFERMARTTFGGNAQIDLDVTATAPAACKGKLDLGDAKVVLVDL